MPKKCCFVVSGLRRDCVLRCDSLGSSPRLWFKTDESYKGDLLDRMREKILLALLCAADATRTCMPKDKVVISIA